jgi:hypothetical protein
MDTTLSFFTETDNPSLEQCQTTLLGISQSFDTMKGLYLMQKVIYYNQTSIEQAFEELADIPFEED